MAEWLLRVDWGGLEEAGERRLLALRDAFSRGRGRDGDCSSPPAQIPACGFPAPGSCRRSDVIGHKACSAGPYAIRARAAPLSMRVPVLCPEHAAPPSLPPAAPLPSTPSAAAHHGLVRALHRYYERVRLLIRSLRDCPLGFPPRPGIASATAGRMRSPRARPGESRGFRRFPFARDRVFNHGRASAPRKTAPYMLP
jgi:hypothetical protein